MSSGKGVISEILLLSCKIQRKPAENTGLLSPSPVTYEHIQTHGTLWTSGICDNGKELIIKVLKYTISQDM